MDWPIAVGLDLSLTGAGVGIVGRDTEDSPPNFECHRLGRNGKRSDGLELRLDRILSLVDDIRSTIVDSGGIGYPELAVIEAPATAASGGSAHDRSALWWFTYKMVRDLGIPIVQVTTQKMKIYATGKGTKVDKEEVLVAMLRRHPDAPIQNNDHADALTLALMGARLLGRPVDGTLAKTYLRALEGVVMP